MQYLSLLLYMRYSVKYGMMWDKLANVIIDYDYKSYSIQYMINFIVNFRIAKLLNSLFLYGLERYMSFISSLI